MKRSLTIVAAVLAFAAAGVLSQRVLLPASATSATVATAERMTSFAIENMTCALCPVTVRTAMSHVAGVKSVKVDFGAKTATAIYDPAIATAAAIAKASTNAGYPATPIEQGRRDER